MATRQFPITETASLDWRIFKSSLPGWFSKAFYDVDLEPLFLVAEQDGTWWIGGWRDQAHIDRVLGGQYRHLLNIARSSSQRRVHTLVAMEPTA